MPTRKILVVDDDREAVRLMRGYLEKAGYTVLPAYDGETALHVLRHERPDLLLLDLMLPGRSGWEIIRILRNDPLLAGTPVIMLTARVTDEDKIVGLELGADDYVTKPYNPREVVARVGARLRSGTELVQAARRRVLRAGDLELDTDRHLARSGGRELHLTATEFELLRVLLEQRGYVVTRQELVRQALGDDYPGLERSLDSHIRNLRAKLRNQPAETHAVSISTIYGVGYRLEEHRPE